MPSTYANYGGAQGYRYQLWLDVTESNVNTAANTSDVTVTCRMATTNNYGYYDSTNQTGNIYIDGQQFTFNSNYPSSGTQTFITQAKTIGHDANGDRTIWISGYHNANQTGLTTSNVGFNVGLTHINRYAAISSFYLDNTTDSTFRINWSADSNCDYVSWWSTAFDGGGHHDIPTSGTGLFQVTPSTTLPSEKQFDVTVAVRRADSGLWTNSGALYTTTLRQSNMFDTMGL